FQPVQPPEKTAAGRIARPAGRDTTVTFAILPVKARVNAKQRLDGFLSAPQREALARVMFEEMLDKLTAARGIDRVVVATSDESVAAYAHTAGVTVYPET